VYIEGTFLGRAGFLTEPLFGARDGVGTHILCFAGISLGVEPRPYHIELRAMPTMDRKVTITGKITNPIIVPVFPIAELNKNH
jgi:hypothetical protein